MDTPELSGPTGQKNPHNTYAPPNEVVRRRASYTRHPRAGSKSKRPCSPGNIGTAVTDPTLHGPQVVQQNRLFNKIKHHPKKCETSARCYLVDREEVLTAYSYPCKWARCRATCPVTAVLTADAKEPGGCHGRRQRTRGLSGRDRGLICRLHFLMSTSHGICSVPHPGNGMLQHHM